MQPTFDILRLHGPRETLVLGFLSVLGDPPDAPVLSDEEDVRRRLVRALTDQAMIEDLRRFLGRWQTNPVRVTERSDRELIDCVATMAIRGPLWAYVVPNFIVEDRNTIKVSVALRKAGHSSVSPEASGTQISTTFFSPASAAENSTTTIFATPIAGLRPEERMVRALQLVPQHLPDFLRDQFVRTLDGHALVVIVATLTVWAESHALGVGFILDVVLLGTGVAVAGVAAIEAAKNLYRFIELVLKAQNEKELDRAAKFFAAAVVFLGVKVFMALMKHGPSRVSSVAADRDRGPRRPQSRPPPEPRLQVRPPPSEPAGPVPIPYPNTAPLQTSDDR